MQSFNGKEEDFCRFEKTQEKYMENKGLVVIFYKGGRAKKK